ncbi:hypothetical protein SteCoe_31577 [Stentor coeruleus]|uniref:Uncharacterized protein n=1 Tax=Stentor coeruleus TaxID=5963 RepID=A0A1R2B101_9CILI|nr:hypothetical protein SteCoe_31577 [Stentor coeruleus]
MFRNNEAKFYKSHYSFDQSSSNIEKLSFLQQNLSLAFETIQELKLERDQLKDSLRNSIEEIKYKKQLQDLGQSSNKMQNLTIENSKKQALKEELQNLKKIAMEKDKIIQAMGKKIKDHKQEKNNLKNINKKQLLSLSNISEKDNYIQILEKRLREQSFVLEKTVSEEDFMNIKIQLKEKTLVLESSLKELASEKSNWKKFYDFLGEQIPEYQKTNNKSLDKNDWQNFSEFVLSLKNSNTEKDLIIESLTEKVKNLTTKKQEKTANNTSYQIKNEKCHTFGLDSIKIPLENLGFLSEIKNLAYIIIEKVHLNSKIHDYFKSRLVCSKRFRSMIENQEFPESLLQVMKLLIDILDYHAIISTKNVYQNESKTLDFTNVPISKKKKSPENSHKITCWTQTNDDKNFLEKKTPIIIGKFDKNYNKNNRSIQTSFDTHEVKFSKTWGQVSIKTPQNKHIKYDISDSSYNEKSSNKNSCEYIKIQENVYDYQQEPHIWNNKSLKDRKNKLNGHKKVYIENDSSSKNVKLNRNPNENLNQGIKHPIVNRIQHIKKPNKERKYNAKDYENLSSHQDFYSIPHTSSRQKNIVNNTSRSIKNEDSSLEVYHKKYQSPESHYENFPVSDTESSYEEIPRPISSIPNRVPSPKKNLDVTLFDENPQLLKISNKKATDLPGINNKISLLVPNNSYTTGDKEYSNFIDHNISEMSFKSMKYQISKDRIYTDSDDNIEKYDEISDDVEGEYTNRGFLSQRSGSRSKKVSKMVGIKKYAKVQKKDSLMSRGNSKILLNTKFNNEEEKCLKSLLSIERSYPNLENSQKLKSSLKYRHNEQVEKDKSSGRQIIDDNYKSQSPKDHDESKISRNSIKITEDCNEKSISPPLNDESFRDLSNNKRHKSPEELDDYTDYYEDASNKKYVEDRKDFKGFSEQNSPKKERKRSGWDLSALEIHVKEPQETSITETSMENYGDQKKEEKLLEGKKKKYRSKTPEEDKNRFKEYKQDIIKEENCWESASDFFTLKKSEENSKDSASLKNM